MDCENTTAPDETLVLMKPVGLEDDLASAVRREDVLAIQAETASTSQGANEFGPAFTRYDSTSDSTTVHDVAVGIYERGLRSFEPRVPLSEFSATVENPVTDSPGNVLVNPARLLVFLIEIGRSEAVVASPVLSRHHIQGESPFRLFAPDWMGRGFRGRGLSCSFSFPRPTNPLSLRASMYPSK